MPQYTRSVDLQEMSPLARLGAILILVGAFALAFVFFTAFLALAGLAALAAPVVLWWQKRKLKKEGPKIVDAEFELIDDQSKN